MKLTFYSFVLFLLCIQSSIAAIKGKIASEPQFAAVVGVPHCSAVFIHPKALLTAGHCAEQLNKNTGLHQ